MNIFPSRLEFVPIPDTVISKSALPDGEFRTHPTREAAFEESNDSLD